MRVLAFLAFSVFGLAVACQRGEVAERASETPPNDRARLPKPLDLTPGTAPGRQRFQSNVWWQRAKLGHEFDLLRLAQREGAAGLLEGVEVGRSTALTALRSLPHAGDAELALPRLCELLQHMRDAPHSALLESVRDIAARPPMQRELLAPGAHAACLPVLQRLTKIELEPARHDLVASAVQLLLEHRHAAKH